MAAWGAVSFRSGRHFLQIPGPTNVPDRVLRAMDFPTIDHRGPEFAALGRDVLEAVKAPGEDAFSRMAAASIDGRPLVGRVPGVRGLFLCSGHGAWGISTGPASARLIVDEILGRESAIPSI